MRLRIEATPEELESKAATLVDSLCQQLRPYLGNVEDVLHKALEKSPVELRSKAMQEMYEQTHKEYEKTLKDMSAEILEVLTKES